MSTAPVVQPGVYLHHKKGSYYTVILTANQSTNGRTGKVVIYVSHTTGEVCARELDEFVEVIEWPDGRKLPRFLKIDRAL